MTYTWEQAKQDAEVAEQMEQQLRGAGWQYVEHQAHRGAGLIELKEQCPHHGPENFQSRLKVEVPNLDHDTRAKLMTLARYLPLLEQNKPNTQRDALKLINARKEEDMPTNTVGSYGAYAQTNGLLRVGAGGSESAKSKAEFEIAYGSKWPTKSEVTPELMASIDATRDKILAAKNPTDTREEADAAREALPKTAQQKLDAAISKFKAVTLAEMREEFQRQLAAAKEEVNKELTEARLVKADADREYAAAVEYSKTVDSYMTMDEFKLIRGCLHADRVPEDLKTRFDKAFKIFNRLEKTVNPKLPIAVLRERGWEKVSPFSKK